jgi:nitrite reductase (cytochrome c-552)
METKPERRRPLPIGWIVFFGSALGVLILGLLATSITERRAERREATLQMVRPIPEWEADNAVWGVNFPRQYNAWEATKTMAENTKYGGSGYRDHLAESPYRVVLWAGYPFAKGYNAPRGHFHAVRDVTETERISERSPATCWVCKSPDVPRLMAREGVAEFYAGRFDDFRNEVQHPIGCADCHNNETMALQISRPALREAFERQGRNIDEATHQEMRSLVCAQCHVEYYFRGEANYLTFPWDQGITAENILAYFEASDHTDWTHAISGARMWKMQHPDWEVYSQGIHAFRGVSCADCHLPYRSEGGVKFTDHQIRSPLYNVENSCQVCHRWSQDEIWQRVTSIQDKTKGLLTRAERTITAGHIEIGEAMRLGATDADPTEPRRLIAQAQMFWDFVSSTNGMGFHAPQESARLLGQAIDLGQQSRLHTTRVLARFQTLQPVTMPELATVQQAQAFIQPFVTAQTAAMERAKQERAQQAEQEQRQREEQLQGSR